MVRHWTEQELKDELANLTILIDSREQQTHVKEYCLEKNIPFKERALETGDYSAMLGNTTLEYDVVCERKHNLDELCQNLTSDRRRFEFEFTRAKANKTKVFLIIENASWSDVFLGNYRSKFSSKSLLASLLSWQVRFNITIIFCKPNETPKLIHSILYYYAREMLLYGHG